MSGGSPAAFRGMGDAAGFVLDAGLLGEARARRRVLALWAAGATLRELPGERWLLLLAEPVRLRAERAPGLVVGEHDGVYVAGGAKAGMGAAGELVEVRHGQLCRHAVVSLPPIDPAAWLDLGRRRTAALEPLDAPATPTPIVPPAAPDAPDMRDVANVAASTKRALKLRPKPDPVAAPGGAPRAPRAQPGRGLAARLLLRSPAAGVLGRRHARYLERLTRAFETADYDTALRDAIGVGGGGHGDDWLTLRLPSRRRGALTPTERERAGGVVPWGGRAQQHLSALYQRAAEQLERAGEIERAAFVHADLLHAPRDAVALLERHGRLELAARLAEGRELDADLVVRLWWQAGDRDRAIDVARARGAWATAVQRMQEVLPQSVPALRTAWVAAEQQAGDHLAAVEAAWPEPALRSLIGGDLAALRAAGGRAGARALALQLAWRHDDATAAEALGLLGERDDRHPERLAFASALGERPAADPALDRRLAGQAIRALLRDADRPTGLTGRAGRAILQRLRERADPLLRADLPPFEPASAPAGVGLLHAPAEPGAATVGDAVCLEQGLLVAVGERGLLLLAHDGRTTARWSVPADRLVVADHGAVVLVVSHGERLDELHRLSLGPRRVTRWASLPRATALQSFDGAILTHAQPDCIAGIDTLGARPRELWRELGDDSRVLAVTRGERWMSAIVDVALQGSRAQRSIERWTWELPSRRLRSRELWAHDWPVPTLQTTADGTLLWLEQDELGATEHRQDVDRRQQTARAPAGAALLVSGEHSALLAAADGELRVSVRAGAPGHAALAVVAFENAATAGFRVHAGVATVWAPDGRVVAVDLATRAAVASVRVVG